VRWYAIHHLNVDRVPVYFRVGDHVVKGMMRLGARGGRQFWVQEGPRDYRQMPKAAQPWCWRPANISDWPDRLPRKTINEDLPDQVADDATESDEDPNKIEKIINPDFRLGGPNERCSSRAEAEARYLRCLLTDRYMERLEPAIRRERATAGDWPREVVIGAKLVELRYRMSRTLTMPGWRDADYDDVFVDLSDKDAKPVPWEPTRRDIGDWEGDAPRWGRGLNRLEQRILRLRCARWSFRGIAGRTPWSYETIRRRYNEAIDKVWRASQRGT
jgi:hypothetical protein